MDSFSSGYVYSESCCFFVVTSPGIIGLRSPDFPVKFSKG